jgi:hypothetical protein
MATGQERVHKVIISGTGRCGTTFLVQLMTELGLDTGITTRNRARKYYEHCNAGLEHDILDPSTPYLIKNPALCDTLAAALATGRFQIDHAYIPIRELGAAAASRADVGGADGAVAGGLWGTSEPAAQRAVLAEMFHGLMHTLAENDIPHTLILFPRMVADPDYTFGKLSYLLKGIARDRFLEAFARTSRPDLVHSFGAGAPRIARSEPRKKKRRLLSRVLGLAP